MNRPKNQDITPGSGMPTYYSDSRGRDRSADSVALVLAVETLIRIATDRQTECAILVSTKNKVGRGTEFEKVVGQEIARRLIRDEGAILKAHQNETANQAQPIGERRSWSRA